MKLNWELILPGDDDVAAFPDGPFSLIAYCHAGMWRWSIDTSRTGVRVAEGLYCVDRAQAIDEAERRWSVLMQERATAHRRI